jgi:hypothetical protein
LFDAVEVADRADVEGIHDTADSQIDVFSADNWNGSFVRTVCSDRVTGIQNSPVEIRAFAASSDGSAIALYDWVLLSAPPESSAVVEPLPMGTAALIVPDAVGQYNVRFSATNIHGGTGACHTMLIATAR